MKLITLILTATLFFAGCMKEEETLALQNEISEKKVAALRIVQEESWSLENLLAVQDYFFTLSEQIHLLAVDSEGIKKFRQEVSKVGIQKFCQAFILPTSYWQKLNQYCDGADFYRCSPEIKAYGETTAKLRQILGPQVAQSFDRERACIN